MADNGIFATTAEVQRKVGAGASTTVNTEAAINQFMTEAESYINLYSNYNWSDVYTTLNVDFKGLLKKAASAMAAFEVVKYDSSNYNSIQEWETILDTLRDEWTIALAEIKAEGNKRTLLGAV